MTNLTRVASLAFVAIAALAACTSTVVRTSAGAPARISAPKPGATAKVQRGDTLYGIAFRNGLDVRDLAAWNGISAPYTIYPGQSLRLSPRSGSPAAGTTASATPRPVSTSQATAASPETRPSSVVSTPSTTPAVAATTPSKPGPAAVGTTPSKPAPAAAGTTPSKPAPAVAGTTPPKSAPATAATSPPKPASTATTAPTKPASTIAATPPPKPSAPVAPESDIRWRWPVEGALLNRFVAGEPTRQGIDISGAGGTPVKAAADGVVVYSGSGLVGYGELVIIKHNDSWLSAYGHNRARMVNEGAIVKAGQQIAVMGRTGAPRDMLHFEIRYNGKPVDPLVHLPKR